MKSGSILSEHGDDLYCVASAAREYPALPPGADPNWKTRLLLNARRAPYGHAANVLTALRHAPEWSGLFAARPNTAVVLFTREPPFPAAPERMRVVNDVDVTLVQEWMQRHRINATFRTVRQAIDVVAREPRQ